MIKAYVFDIGGTLEDTFHDPKNKRICGEALLHCLRSHGIAVDTTPEAFTRHIEETKAAYRTHIRESCHEASPYELWSEWFLAGMEADNMRLRIIADTLCALWERLYFTRSLRPDAHALLQGLKERGFRLGVISNTSSQTQALEALYEYGVRAYFDVVYLSALSGCRKPHVALFHAAAAELNALPEECVYVGDTVSRDVRGARAAGYAAAIRIDSPITGMLDAGGTNDEEADYLVTRLMDILDLDIARR